MVFLTLIHRTNYKGFTIDPAYTGGDPEIGGKNVPCISFQACPGYRAKPSDPGQGEKNIYMWPRLLEAWLGAKTKWTLFHVSDFKGTNSRHVFNKVALCNTKNKDLIAQAKKKKWETVLDSIPVSELFDELGCVFEEEYWELDNKKTFNHVHVAVCTLLSLIIVTVAN